jgi:hypothetical protein
MIAKRSESYEIRPEERNRDLTFAAIAVIYTVFMIIAGGLTFHIAVRNSLCTGYCALCLGAARTEHPSLRSRKRLDHFHRGNAGRHRGHCSDGHWLHSTLAITSGDRRDKA